MGESFWKINGVVEKLDVRIRKIKIVKIIREERHGVKCQS
jgi:hypothetical protein